MIVILTIFSLFAGLACGFLGLGETVFAALGNNTDWILYVLMLCVGIMIGMREGIAKKIREYHVRIFLIPAGIIAGSVLGGMLCAMILKMPVEQGAAIAGGMGWYSLAGATISSLCGAEAGSIAFLSNLMREIFSFFIIPFLAVKLNDYTCIAPAGATSEDTTLPMMLKYTNEETVVLSVLNGMICSFFVPILIALFLGTA